jgi:hypothetical protein
MEVEMVTMFDLTLQMPDGTQHDGRQVSHDDKLNVRYGAWGISSLVGESLPCWEEVR